MPSHQSKGGKRRAESKSANQRKDIAKKGGKAKSHNTGPYSRRGKKK